MLVPLEEAPRSQFSPENLSDAPQQASGQHSVFVQFTVLLHVAFYSYVSHLVRMGTLLEAWKPVELPSRIQVRLCVICRRRRPLPTAAPATPEHKE